MKTKIMLFVLLFSVGCANAGDIDSVKDQEKVWLLRGVSVLMNKTDPREFPAIIRVVSLPVPLDECEPNAVTEEVCPQKDLYLVFSNWDIAADVHAFRVGRADNWRVGELMLEEKKSQSFWTASLILESDKYVDDRKVIETMKIRIRNNADQYTLVSCPLSGT